MTSKIFRTHLVVRVIILLLLGNGGLYLLIHTPFWMLSIWCLLFTIILCIEFIRYIEKNYRLLGDFLMGIQQDDFVYTKRLSERMNNARLKTIFRHITALVGNLRMEAESNYQYLQTVINHVDIGLICFNSKEQVNLVNKVVYQLFDLQNISTLHALKQSDRDFYQLIKSISPGEKKLYQARLNGSIYQFAMHASYFRQKNEDYKLVSFQNIHGEMEKKEMESWYRLTRVLTHEIMNSAIPISNLSGMIYETLMDKKGQFTDLLALEEESQEEIKQSLQTIKHRSKGLVNFVNSTKKITRLPLPEFQDTDILALAKRVFSLYTGKLKEKRIGFSVKSQTNHTILSADPQQLEQVFINLLQNAIDATAKCASPKIHLNIQTTAENRLMITFSDNGKGMTNKEKDQVFIPYFTTKKQGTGIGMTFSRQIIHNHRGNMEVYSEPGKGTEVRIIFSTRTTNP